MLDYRGIIVVAMTALLSLPGLIALAETSSAQRASLFGPTEPLTAATGLEAGVPTDTDAGQADGNESGNETSEGNQSSDGDQETDETQTQETSDQENNSSEDSDESEELDQTSSDGDDGVASSPGLAVLVVVFVVAAGGLLLWARM